LDRDAHVGALLERLLGVPGIVVNNSAAAFYLALQELAAGGEAIVSRSDKLETSDGLRIADLAQRAGVKLRLVGASDRTTVDDYRAAINQHTRLILLICSGCRKLATYAAPERREIAEMAREAHLPLYEKIASGYLSDFGSLGACEPRPQDALLEGVNLVSFSCDKLLGGPQAGVLAGEEAILKRIRANPLRKVLSADKLAIGALEETLRRTLFEEWDAIPARRMMAASAESIRARAEEMAEGLAGTEVVEGDSTAAACAVHELRLPTWLLAVKVHDVAGALARLRTQQPPVIVRAGRGRLLVDLRTVMREEEADLRRALHSAVRADQAGRATSR
jgi:L-seryl-tRNA(Ser) seleniumtransferase